MESQGRPGVSRHRSRRRTGFAFLTFTRAVLESGIQIVLEETKLREYVKDADLVITGEGRLDGQTVMGKAPVGVARIAKEFHKPVLAFSGSVTREAAACNAAGIDAFFPILRSVCHLEEAMDPEKCQKKYDRHSRAGIPADPGGAAPAGGLRPFSPVSFKKSSGPHFLIHIVYAVCLDHKFLYGPIGLGLYRVRPVYGPGQLLSLGSRKYAL